MNRRLPSSPAAEPEPPPLENDDLLGKILLRLPPLPSSLPRASAVCKRWRGLVSDPHFVRRFRIRHRRNPPLLGCFVDDGYHVRFQPALEDPDRVPQSRFSFTIDDARNQFWPLGCRHGLVLSFHNTRMQLLVYESFIGGKHLLDIPQGLKFSSIVVGVLRAAEDVRCFQVVLVRDMRRSQAFVYVYSSETGVWGDAIAGPLPPDDPTPMGFDPPGFYHDMSSVMVGDSLHWMYKGNSPAIIEFDLVTQCLALIPMPVDEFVGNGKRNMWVVQAEGGGLGFLFLTGFCAQLWKREKDCDGVASWVLGRSIQLYRLLSLELNPYRKRPRIVGFAEDKNVVLLQTYIGVFILQLESLQFKNIFTANDYCTGFLPCEVVYTADKGIGDGHTGAEPLQNI